MVGSLFFILNQALAIDIEDKLKIAPAIFFTLFYRTPLASYLTYVATRSEVTSVG